MIMSCPNCGAKLELGNQRFCQDCGHKLLDFSNKPELEQQYSTSQETRNLRQLQIKSVKTSSSRPLSKASLGLGIVSVIIAATTFNFGTSFFMPPYILPLSVRQILIVVFGILNIIGLVFGIISKATNIKAKRIEIRNTAMKAGSMLGIMGIIFNTLLMIVAFTSIGIFVL
jgi:hypothetical protein